MCSIDSPPIKPLSIRCLATSSPHQAIMAALCSCATILPMTRLKKVLVSLVGVAVIAAAGYGIAASQSHSVAPAVQVPNVTTPSQTPATPIQQPTPSSQAPDPAEGATALCSDGTYSYSQNHQGTCSHHGGVSEWYQ